MSRKVPGWELLSNKDTDGTLAANSDTKYPSQKAVKAYAVTGPASVAGGELATFNGATGKVIQASSLTGMLKAASGIPAVAVAGTDYDPIPALTSLASSATPTPAVGTAGAEIRYHLTALAEAPTFGAPTGTPVDGQLLTIRIKDDGTARALSWNAIYRAGTALPLLTTTVLSKTMYCNFVYNSADSKWDFVGTLGGF